MLWHKHIPPGMLTTAACAVGSNVPWGKEEVEEGLSQDLTKCLVIGFSKTWRNAGPFRSS